MRQSNYTKEQKEFMRENYPSLSTKECAEKMGGGITEQQIRSFCKVYKIRKNDRYNGERFSLSDFMHPRIPELIYFLGFLWGDGYIPQKSSSAIIRIQKEDGDILYNIIKGLGPFQTTPAKYGTKKETLCIRLNDRSVVEYLVEMDYKNKSYVSPSKIIKTIPEDLRYLFWLGFSDADGCFTSHSTPRFSIHGTYDQDWKDIISTMELLDCQVKPVKRIRETGRGSSIEIWSRFDVVKWGRYLYQSFEILNIGLPRKYQKFLEIIEKNITKKNNSTGFRGVSKYWRKKTKSFAYRGMVQFEKQVFGKRLLFDTAEEAAIFVDRKNVELRGNRTFTNFPIDNYL